MPNDERDQILPDTVGHDLEYIPDNEDRDIHVRAVALVGAAILGAIVVIYVVLTFTLNRLGPNGQSAIDFKLPSGGPEQVGQPPNFPAPRLQVNEWQDRADLEGQWNQLLNSYGWVDQKAGIAHIPINAAMDAVARQGLPAKQAQMPRNTELDNSEGPWVPAEWNSGQPPVQPTSAQNGRP